MRFSRGTGPHSRESHEEARLSPITKYSSFGTRGHVCVVESRRRGSTYASWSGFPSM